MDPSPKVRMHIMECDRMYESAWGKPDNCPETSVCKRILDMGGELDAAVLPQVCIRQCERWNLRWSP